MHVEHFTSNVLQALFRIAIKCRTLPVARRHHFCARSKVASMHWGLAKWIEAAPCNMSQFLGSKRRTGSGHTCFADTALGRFCHQTCGWQGRMTSLRWPHTHSRKAFDQLHIPITTFGGIDDIANLQVFVEIDKFLAFRMFKDRPRKIH